MAIFHSYVSQSQRIVLAAVVVEIAAWTCCNKQAKQLLKSPEVDLEIVKIDENSVNNYQNSENIQYLKQWIFAIKCWILPQLCYSHYQRVMFCSLPSRTARHVPRRGHTIVCTLFEPEKCLVRPGTAGTAKGTPSLSAWCFGTICSFPYNQHVQRGAY